jgi:AcrR family transcriptional regulator
VSWQRLEADERRRLILDEARRQFCSRLYGDVSMTDIASGAGVARGLLHHYFGSKRDLYLAVIRDLVRVPTIPTGAEGRGSERDVWSLSVEGWMALVEANRELWLSAISAGAAAWDHEVDEILNEARELVAGRALEALGVAPAQAPPGLLAVARGYGGLVEEVTREWLERGRLTRDEARGVLLHALPALVEGWRALSRSAP